MTENLFFKRAITAYFKEDEDSKISHQTYENNILLTENKNGIT
jgi:hypothetical protein